MDSGQADDGTDRPFYVLIMASYAAASCRWGTDVLRSENKRGIRCYAWKAERTVNGAEEAMGIGKAG